MPFRARKTCVCQIGYATSAFFIKTGKNIAASTKTLINDLKLGMADREEAALNSFWRKLCVKCANLMTMLRYKLLFARHLHSYHDIYHCLHACVHKTSGNCGI